MMKFHTGINNFATRLISSVKTTKLLYEQHSCLRNGNIRTFSQGKATPNGTKRFLLQSQISLYHKFFKSDLLINPIAISHPTLLYGASNDLTYQQYEYCIKINRSNCLSIYYHNGIDQEWYFKDLKKLLMKTQTSRDQLVLVATIAISVLPNQDIAKQIERIQTLCSINHIDFLILEVREMNK